LTELIAGDKIYECASLLPSFDQREMRKEGVILSPKRLEVAKKKTVGTRQTLKVVEKGTADLVYVANDAEKHVIKPLVRLCGDNNIPIVYVDTMEELGKACGIEVKAASAAIVKE